MESREKKEPLTPMSSLKTFVNQEARTMAPFVMKVAKLESIESRLKMEMDKILSRVSFLFPDITGKMFYVPESLRSR